MPGVGLFLVIIAGMFLTGFVALYVARNVEHGEARFGEDGRQLSAHPPEEPAKDMGLTMTQDGVKEE